MDGLPDPPQSEPLDLTTSRPRVDELIQDQPLDLSKKHPPKRKIQAEVSIQVIFFICYY